jgi:arylsulfatase A-like enzyme
MKNLSRLWFGVLVIVLLAIIITVRWWVSQPTPIRNNEAAAHGAITKKKTAEPANVPIVIYLVDTLRADRLGLYGYERGTSWRLDALAAESVVFEQAYAAAPWTIPSVASLFTSTFVCEHQLTHRQKLNIGLKTLAERLKSAGYATGSFIANPLAGHLTDLHRGFDEAVAHKALDDISRLENVRRFLSRAGDRPFFLYVHTMEPHNPYLVPDRYIARFGHDPTDQMDEYHESMLRYTGFNHADWKAGRPLGTSDYTGRQDELLAYFKSQEAAVQVVYDAAVLYADANAQNLVDELRRNDLWNKAIYIFLSDHGEEFGDHGGWFHGQSTYEELLRVPLLIHFPDGEFAGQRIDAPVSLVDIMPTIFDYLRRRDLCDSCQGQSLLPLLRGSRDVGDAGVTIPAMRLNRIDYYRPWQESRGDVNVVLRQDRWKGIWNDDFAALELYDIALDPAEQSDVSAKYAEITGRLGRKAEAWLRDCRKRATEPNEMGEIDAGTEEQLRALGYFN